MGWESSFVVRFVKSAYNWFIIDPRGLNVKPTCRISWAENLLM